MIASTFSSATLLPQIDSFASIATSISLVSAVSSHSRPCLSFPLSENMHSPRSSTSLLRASLSLTPPLLSHIPVSHSSGPHLSSVTTSPSSTATTRKETSSPSRSPGPLSFNASLQHFASTFSDLQLFSSFFPGVQFRQLQSHSWDLQARLPLPLHTTFLCLLKRSTQRACLRAVSRCRSFTRK